MKKLFLLLLLSYSLSVQAEVLTCYYSTGLNIDNRFRYIGDVVSINGDRFAFMTQEKNIIVGNFNNCFLQFYTEAKWKMVS